MNKPEIEKYVNKTCCIIFDSYITNTRSSVKGIIESVNKGVVKYNVANGRSYYVMPAKRIISIEEVE